ARTTASQLKQHSLGNQTMRKVNLKDLEEHSWASPKGKFAGASKEISEGLGRKPTSTDLMERHPFDAEMLRLAPGQTPYPFHSHSAQWEFYYVVSGRGTARDKDGTMAIEPGDALLFLPDEAHQFTNNGTEDLLILVIADNPIGESAYYPDSKKWLVRSPERRLMRGESLDYFDGEE
ncbi:MAG: cupin domain-containing protein, partial [Chthoniobacterales bacterium]